VWRLLQSRGWTLPSLRSVAGRRFAFFVDPDGNQLFMFGVIAARRR
jgi:hypothetical protein